MTTSHDLLPIIFSHLQEVEDKVMAKEGAGGEEGIEIEEQEAHSLNIHPADRVQPNLQPSVEVPLPYPTPYPMRRRKDWPGGGMEGSGGGGY